ncbi:hypothetical protein SAMN05660841_03039 [Sphingobacterium nematocida]|uniref:Uncharacterized protein n=2 Tax=Sphingobacterium nematocida TaxID=1513896 RepID=A0A1T5F532_9SPHI|nr:hypothetical protein SAMN05660841_03039 [Sphingobacterium nematocida]
MYYKIIFIISLFSILNNKIQAQDTKMGRLENLGAQITANMIQGSVFLHDVGGKSYAYTVVRGEPAHLLGYDLSSKELILDHPLQHADGAWDLAFTTDGYLYIPGASGILFRHRPGTHIVENLGQALAGETYVWNLAAGKDGEVFGATYPGCRVFRYHPIDGFSDVGKGPIVQSENYVRSLAYHQDTDRLYVGVGSHAHLFRLDPRTAEKEDLLPEKYRTKEFVYGLEIVPGRDGADRLFALLTSGRETLVYNLKTGIFEQVIDSMDMKALAFNANQVYYTSGGNLKTFDPTQDVNTAQTLSEQVGSANALSICRDSLYMLNAAGKLFVYDLRTRDSAMTALEIPGQPIPINALLFGPDRKIWMGGYLAGGHATFDPESGISTEWKGLDQTEGMVGYGHEIFFGIYPKGRFYRYDTNKAWNPELQNPQKLGEIEEQGRSFALVAAKDREKLYFGMIPEYGLLGGALVEFDRKKESLISHGVPIEDQAISSLVYKNRKLWIGTTISGGLGVKPSTQEAKLCVWNPDMKTIEQVIVPVKGAPAITGLIEGRDGNLLGVAGGKLFVYDTQHNSIIESFDLYEQKPMGSHIWRSAFLVLHPSGDIYGTVDNKLFKLDVVKKMISIIHNGASLLTMDDKGHLYFRNKTELWRYIPE